MRISIENSVPVIRSFSELNMLVKSIHRLLKGAFLRKMIRLNHEYIV